MNEDLNDILYDIDMQLYDEFNDKIATMNDYLGDIYSLRDVEEVEKAEKEKEIELLREAVRKLQKQIEELQAINQMPKYRIEVMDERELISRDKVEETIKAKIEELYETKQYWNNEVIKILQSILEKLKEEN